MPYTDYSLTVLDNMNASASIAQSCNCKFAVTLRCTSEMVHTSANVTMDCDMKPYAIY